MRSFLIFCLLSLGLACQTAFASPADQQPNPKAKARIERFQKDRLTHIQRRVQLTAQQTKTLEALLEKHDKARFVLFKEAHDISKSLRDRNNVTEQEYVDALDNYSALEKKGAAIEEELIKNLRDSFPPKEAFNILREMHHFYARAGQRVLGGK